MPIFIFDTRGGLCNQFYDINCGINFCLLHNFKFTFRYCLFRNADLISWYERNFDDLFDTKMFEKYDNYKRRYYENSVSGLTQWIRPQGGGKTGKKKKRIIKRQKTYKNKRYTKRKTIKR